ncbi:MAG: efflux RND transporter periplasmic adaptor subunit [Nitrospinae bacterium]|nr:efflux RND transporter periplasmic adaptor subunit [Nitrospinota bacterium]
MSEFNSETGGVNTPAVYRKRFALTVALALAIAAGYYGWSYLSHRGAAQAPAAKSDEKGRAILFYRHPMDPSITSDRPAKDSMNMDYIPVYADEAAAAGVVSIDPAVAQTIGVRYATARRTTLAREIRTTGIVTYDETRLARIQPKVMGWVEKLYVNETGRKINVDDILLELYSPDLVTTQEEFILALKYRDAVRRGEHDAIVKGGESLLESSRRRLALFDVPPHQIEELERTRQVKKTLHIHSPVSGVIISKNVTEGSYIMPGDTLYEIADASRVWVNADVYEYEAPYVRVGQSAVLTLAAAPGRALQGKITYIYPYLDPKTRSAKARVEFDNRDGVLKFDMYGDVAIRAGEAHDALVIPSEAVIRTGARKLVFISLGGGRFEPRPVTTGIDSGGEVEILSGLSEGETVVTSSQFLIDSESKLREAIGKMGGAPDAGHQHGGQAAAPVSAPEPEMTAPTDDNGMSGMDMITPPSAGEGGAPSRGGHAGH